MEMNNKKRRQSMILYVIIALAVMFALNQSFNAYQRKRIQEVSYSEFLSKVEAKQVENVELDTSSSRILYTTKDGDKSHNNEHLQEREAASGPLMAHVPCVPHSRLRPPFYSCYQYTRQNRNLNGHVC